jgi:hypothetical protein
LWLHLDSFESTAMRAAFLSTLLAGGFVISNDARAADLPIRTKPAMQREAPPLPEHRRQLFERFLQYLTGTGSQ